MLTKEVNNAKSDITKLGYENENEIEKLKELFNKKIITDNDKLINEKIKQEEITKNLENKNLQ